MFDQFSILSHLLKKKKKKQLHSGVPNTEPTFSYLTWPLSTKGFQNKMMADTGNNNIKIKR